MQNQEVSKNSAKYLEKNLEIQGLFMKEIIDNIDVRLEAIKALYQAKKVGHPKD